MKEKWRKKCISMILSIKHPKIHRYLSWYVTCFQEFTSFREWIRRTDNVHEQTFSTFPNVLHLCITSWFKSLASVIFQVGAIYLTVQPLSSGHPGGKLEVNRDWCTLNIFHHLVNFSVNMVSLRDKHDKHVFECFYHLSLLFWTIIRHCLIENKVSKFWAAV